MGDGTLHDFGIGMKFAWLCGLSKLISFQCRDRSGLGFCVAVENDLFSVS